MNTNIKEPMNAIKLLNEGAIKLIKKQVIITKIQTANLGKYQSKLCFANLDFL